MKKKAHASADAFFAKLMKDPEIRMLYQEERAKTEIAYAIKAARQRAKLTQAQLAKKVGTSQSVIARMESGEDERTPTLPLLARIASACNGALEIGFTFKRAI